LQRFEQGQYGRCRRHHCHQMPLLPCGQSSRCGIGGVRVYCVKCRELYYPDSTHRRLDGAAFGPSLPGLLVLAHPAAVQQVMAACKCPGVDGCLGERYEPRIFGFRLHQE
jgi:casein kinase II subunit beta